MNPFRLQPCGRCVYCVPDMDGAHGRCHRESPVMLRGNERAVWPQVDPDAAGCGKFRHPASVAPEPQGSPA